MDKPTRIQLFGVECDTHGQALHDLDPVAGCILRRKQRERRACASREAGNGAVVDDGRAVNVSAQLYRLVGPHVLELHFLEVRLNPH